eukprot:s4388_g6.t1
MGQPIFLGVSTTFLAILPLAFSASQAFRVFFKMFFGIVVAGGSHGLIFLPVCMSMFGPSVTKPAATEGALDADVEKPSKADKEEPQKAKELDDKWTVRSGECVGQCAIISWPGQQAWLACTSRAEESVAHGLGKGYLWRGSDKMDLDFGWKHRLFGDQVRHYVY